MSLKNKNYLDTQAGFTLIELIVAIFGFTLIIWGLIGLVSGIIASSKSQSTLLSDTDQARKLAFQMAFELRNGQTGSNGAYVLEQALPQQLVFYSNIDSTIATERVRYFVQNKQLYKGITAYNGSSYNTSTEAVYLVQTDLANGANPVFTYYDGGYSGLSNQQPLAQPVNVTQVKFVKISLQVYDKAGQTGNNVFTVSSGAAIRNLKTNLGQ